MLFKTFVIFGHLLELGLSGLPWAGWAVLLIVVVLPVTIMTCLGLTLPLRSTCMVECFPMLHLTMMARLPNPPS